MLVVAATVVAPSAPERGVTLVAQIAVWVTLDATSVLVPIFVPWPISGLIFIVKERRHMRRLERLDPLAASSETNIVRFSSAILQSLQVILTSILVLLLLLPGGSRLPLAVR